MTIKDDIKFIHPGDPEKREFLRKEKEREKKWYQSKWVDCGADGICTEKTRQHFIDEGIEGLREHLADVANIDICSLSTFQKDIPAEDWKEIQKIIIDAVNKFHGHV